jgi:peroxiredoxin
MIRILPLILTVFVLTIPSLSHAKGSVNVGDTIPHDLSLQDYDEKMRSFSDLTGSKGLVLVFVRSANWCPYCQKQLIELDESTERFKEWGYNVVSVSYDTPGDMQRFVTTQKPKLTLLSDPRSKSIRAFGILNEEVAKGTRSYGVPYPGVYIVDKNKKVQATFFKEGYKDRPATRDILAKIEQLNPPEVPEMTMEEMGTDPIDPENAYVEIPQEELPPLIESNVGDEVPTETAPQEEVIENVVDDVEAQASDATGMDVEILEPTIQEEMPEGAPEIEQVEPTRATGPDAL